MTPERWAFLGRYAKELFEDDELDGITERARAAGLPQIAVSADVGRLLQILTLLTPGRLALELGTLAGYSGSWIARGLMPGGKLITIEYDPRHADFAEGEFARNGLDDRVEVVRGAALDVLPDLAQRLGPESVDLVFLDAVKTEYIAYLELSKPLLAHGGVLVADNVYATGQGWIDEGYGTDEFNRRVAADPDFDSTITPMREGLLIARKR
ncbi:MAG: O-methyltransferase [Actinobacteria bacterium]|nr:O-methyltransferase [Actinomycetota bacterium]